MIVQNPNETKEKVSELIKFDNTGVKKHKNCKSNCQIRRKSKPCQNSVAMKTSHSNYKNDCMSNQVLKFVNFNIAKVIDGQSSGARALTALTGSCITLILFTHLF